MPILMIAQIQQYIFEGLGGIDFMIVVVVYPRVATGKTLLLTGKTACK